VFFPPPSEGDGDGDGEGGSTSRLVASFAVYGGAFIMRPVGGLVIGRIGDMHGRKRALVVSLSLMAFPTFLM
jgi:MHS family proline/betaine transporter-like MFS transporter